MNRNSLPTYFISDIHLSEDNPELTELFLNFLEFMARKGAALYILGDLFEAWLGDDDPRPLAKLVAKHLHNLSQDGIKVYLMQGNRDIMMGEDYAKQCGAKLLPDPTVIYLHKIPTLLSHGDCLCTFDTKHQSYRKLTLDPKVRWIFLHLPLSIRNKIATYLRNKSKSHQTQVIKQLDNKNTDTSIDNSNLDILDVNPAEVIHLMKLYECSQLIHGHTHKPSIHHIPELSPPGTRIVLGDWGKLGSVLVTYPDGLELQYFS